jgi:hypothetical protein
MQQPPQPHFFFTRIMVTWIEPRIWSQWVCAVCRLLDAPLPFSKTNGYIYNFQRWMSRFPQRWRTQRNAIRNANCKTSWIIKILNAHCAFGIFPVACLSECLWIPLSVGLLTWAWLVWATFLSWIDYGVVLLVCWWTPLEWCCSFLHTDMMLSHWTGIGCCDATFVDSVTNPVMISGSLCGYLELFELGMSMVFCQRCLSGTLLLIVWWSDSLSTQPIGSLTFWFGLVEPSPDLRSSKRTRRI